MKKAALVILVPGLILLLPLVAMQFTDEVNWSPADFAVAWVLMVGAGLAYKLAAGRQANVAQRTAVGLAVAGGFMLIWINLAVGLIGNTHNPANLIYSGVLAVGFIGAIIARFQPRGMARALFATALAQVLVTVVALIFWQPQVTLGVLGVNVCFVLLFIGSALLFRRAARAQV